MRKFLSILSLLVVVVLMSSGCSSSTSTSSNKTTPKSEANVFKKTPPMVIENCLWAATREDYKEYYVYFSKNLPKAELDKLVPLFVGEMRALGIESQKIEGNEATVSYKINGGQPITTRLILEDGQWRISEINSIFSGRSSEQKSSEQTSSPEMDQQKVEQLVREAVPKAVTVWVLRDRENNLLSPTMDSKELEEYYKKADMDRYIKPDYYGNAVDMFPGNHFNAMDFNGNGNNYSLGKFHGYQIKKITRTSSNMYRANGFMQLNVKDRSSNNETTYECDFILSVEKVGNDFKITLPMYSYSFINYIP